MSLLKKYLIAVVNGFLRNIFPTYAVWNDEFLRKFYIPGQITYSTVQNKRLVHV